MNVPQLSRLAGRLATLSRDLEGHADRLLVYGMGPGLDPATRRRLREVAGWADDQHRMIRALLAEVQRLERLGALPPGLSLSRRRHRAFAEPGPAHAAARRFATLVGGQTEVALRQAAAVVEAYAHDPVFVATALHALGARGVVAHLHRADRRGYDGRSTDSRLVDGLARVLATAWRTEVSPVTWADLADEAAASPSGPRSLGLLFVGPAVFPPSALAGAVRHLVVPWNRAVRARPSTASTLWRLRVAGRTVDGRAAVLTKVARDRTAARSAVHRVDLDHLLDAEVAYADGGRALAEVLVAGTAPTTAHAGRAGADPLVTGERPDDVRAARSLRRVVVWMAGNRSAPVEVERHVDRILGPWIGSVRSAGLDGPVTRHVDLDEQDARRVVALGVAHPRVRDRLAATAWAWAAREVRRLASGRVTGTGFDAVGSVLGIVSSEGHAARAASAARLDLERDRQRSLWSTVQGHLTKPLPGPARGVVGALATPVRNRVLADTDIELEYWREHRDRDVGHEALALEYLVLGALWEHRRDNEYFDVVGGAPPPSVLGGGVGGLRLRPLASLDEAGVADYLAWRSRLAADRGAPVQLAAERFLAEGRESDG